MRTFKFFRRLWPCRWIRAAVWTLLSLTAIIALTSARMDWSGERRWREARALLVKEGQTLDFRAMAPEPIPDAENFCASFAGINHGGQPALNPVKPEHTRFWDETYAGDWVWDFPEKQTANGR